MTDQYALTPKQAIEVIKAAGVDDAAKLIRDHAAAGLVRSYAQVQVTINTRGERTCVRGGAVASAAWERMICGGVDSDVWGGGTVRLAGSDLVGGTPALHVTGIAFHADDIERLSNQQRPASRVKAAPKRVAVEQTRVADEDPADVPSPRPTRQRGALDLSALHSGALLLTVKQTEAALAISHTTVYKLINAGKLERPAGETRITAESVRRYAGLID
ncbi:hypothetical protein ASE75_13835 [Sphingomonas sp. Leaf17]|uniref:helix-turn-helix domain-containing protein n=1 Tax=Sphingomonas sp. Leaf17 TaxID=1735683 RepID=UPI0006F1D931|nr:helix-turn-helix domain-containing protein [Sphingomonas sp. Leaf17]KQM62703.1 hypothetical protein ASE75_13835 [Sphingomonas sp. Leaf17]